MAYFDGIWLRLDDSEMSAVHERIMNPDREALRLRDELFAELDRNPGVLNDDGSFEFEFSLKPAASVVTTHIPWAEMFFEIAECIAESVNVDVLRHEGVTVAMNTEVYEVLTAA